LQWASPGAFPWGNFQAEQKTTASHDDNCSDKETFSLGGPPNESAVQTAAKQWQSAKDDYCVVGGDKFN